MRPNRITTAEGKVYELVSASTIGKEKGEVVAGDTVEVTYVYKEVKGNVIAEDEKDETDASLNAKYDTTDNKPAKLEKAGTVYYLQSLQKMVKYMYLYQLQLRVKSLVK